MVENKIPSRVLRVFRGNDCLAAQVLLADTPHLRGTGLMGRRALGEEQGLLMSLPPALQGKRGVWVSIHMLLVPFPLAVAWLDSEGCVVHRERALPWHPYYTSRYPAWYTLELHPSRLPQLAPGVRLRWEKIHD